MDGGFEIALSEEDVQVVVQKYNNEVEPREAVLLSEMTLDYTADTDYFTTTIEGIAPWFVLLDAVLAVVLWGSGSTFAILGVLHVKRRIVLPFAKLKRARPGLRNQDLVD